MSTRASILSLDGHFRTNSRDTPSQAIPLSNSSLLINVRDAYLSSRSYELDSSTSIVVNSWLNAYQGTLAIDKHLAERVWEHACRRTKDQTVILSSLHRSTPSVLEPLLSSLPFTLPSSIFSALNAIQPLINCVTPENPSTPRYAALGVRLTLGQDGALKGVSLNLSRDGLDTKRGLFDVPQEAGYRAFDVFYYILKSVTTDAEREYLRLDQPSKYALLNKSKTFNPPSYIPTAEDAAAAGDFRQALREIGIKGSLHRDFISSVVGLLKFGNTLSDDCEMASLVEACEDAGSLLGIEPSVLHDCSLDERQSFSASLYESLVHWVISKANEVIALQFGTVQDKELDDKPGSDDGNSGDFNVTIIDVPEPAYGKAFAMQSAFDDSLGLNAAMIKDGMMAPSVGAGVLQEMQRALSNVTPTGTNRQSWPLKDILFSEICSKAEDDSFLQRISVTVEKDGAKDDTNRGLGSQFDVSSLITSTQVWHHLSLHPSDEKPATFTESSPPSSVWSTESVSRQILSWRLSEWANRRRTYLGFTAHFEMDEFSERYSPVGCQKGQDGINYWLMQHNWHSGQVFVGNTCVWMCENTWREAESLLDLELLQGSENGTELKHPTYYHNSLSSLPFIPGPYGSRDQLLTLHGDASQVNLDHQKVNTAPPSIVIPYPAEGKLADDFKPNIEPTYKDFPQSSGDPEMATVKHTEVTKTTTSRRIWVTFVWALTFWIPTPLLRHVGRMKRPDVQMAWREKVVLVFIIMLINAWLVFWVVAFGRLLCPNMDKAWSRKQVATHQGDDDFWVSIHGKIYDITDFWKQQHSDTDIETTTANMQPLAGLDLDNYFVPPLHMVCKGLGIKKTTRLATNNTPEYVTAVHTSGYYATDRKSALYNEDWYWTNFEPGIKEYYHGDLVYSKSKVKDEGENQHMWAMYGDQIYDLTDYFYTQDLYKGADEYVFLNESITDLWKKRPGQNIKKALDEMISLTANNKTAQTNVMRTWNCIQNRFYKGKTDFRESARCQVNNWVLLSFMIMVCVVVLAKFLAALRFGSKYRPSAQDKFVICQIPAYTEDENSLRKALDSLSDLNYDNKHKLICVICDGVVVGSGNDRPTHKLLLDILGVDPRVDPPALPCQSVGAGSSQLNYGKVYSGLYEYEGNVVPYLVIVKVGKESERSKPGNRGKRDTQVLLMRFLNRVHHRSPMNPLELEMYHQIRNVIGVDPGLYEYLLMIDADTCVHEDALKHLVASCAYDAKIAGICGETQLDNSERSWWTMIQVYEYFISHHLTKSFESLFGSVTCLPGCFTMYRLRTADGRKPLIISDAVIRDYSVGNVDTLHQKNLLALGEDRYLTTLMTKHFPQMAYKFLPDATCKTTAPDSWKVLLSQRRRWINSTIHNLMELVCLKDLCGFAFFSMRAVVFLDLCSTIILPATCAYIIYLIINVTQQNGQFPLISIILLAAVYGLQALLFLLMRKWEHIGWMIIHLLAYPVNSVILPIYSFWNQDNFTWGNTRVVVGEDGNKQVVAVNDESFDPRSIPLQLWDDYACANDLPHTHAHDPYQTQLGMMCSARQLGSTMTLNTLVANPHRGSYATNSSIADYLDPLSRNNAQSTMFGGVAMSDYAGTMAGVQPGTYTDLDIKSHRDSAHLQSGSRLSMLDRSGHPSFCSTTSLQLGQDEPEENTIVEAIRSVLSLVDLDTITKKQVRVLVEHRLQRELVGKSRSFMDQKIDEELENM
ncbi:hypothetical protein FDECE_12286 [Fusarium decemcellulare]|nr:hypothetical protein FDECE_12286 [Fusarium decemcellulare]